MEAYHEQHPNVKHKISGNLSILPDGRAEVDCSLGKVVLPDVPYSRWYLKTHFEHITATEQAAAWYQKHNPLKLPPIPGLQIPLWEHQKLAVFRMCISNDANWLDMGCGKTAVSLAFSLLLFSKGLNYYLILCPPTVFVTWLDEIAKFIDPKLLPEIYILHGPKKAKNLAELRTNTLNHPKFILTSYETLESIREELQILPISACFFDESSRAKNIEAKRTQSCHALTNAMPRMRRFALSGTPSTKNCLGLYSQYELLGKGFSGHQTYTSFEKEFAVSKLFAMIRLPHGKITSVDADEPDKTFPIWLAEHCPPGNSKSYMELGYSFSKQPGPGKIRILNYHRRNIKFINQDKLHAITQTHAYTVFKDEIFDLPPKTHTKRLLEMPDDQRKAYADLLETNRTLLAGTPFSFHHGSPYCKLHQLANGYIRNTDGSYHFFPTQPKLNELEEIIEEAGDQKIIIWSPFRPQIAQVIKFLNEELNIPALELHGDTPQNKRIDVVHSFCDSAGPQIMVSNPEVGGMGLNLTAAALEIFMTNWFKPDTRKQAEDRIWRPGQTRRVTVVDLVMRATLEVKILRNTLAEVDTERENISMNMLKGE